MILLIDVFIAIKIEWINVVSLQKSCNQNLIDKRSNYIFIVVLVLCESFNRKLSNYLYSITLSGL